MEIQVNKIKNFSHYGNAGDVLASLPCMKEFYNKTKIRPVLYLVKDHPAHYYEGAVHPIKDNKGNNVSLNEAMNNMLIPLLKSQDYLEDVKEVHTNDVQMAESLNDEREEVIHVNLSKIRDTFCNIPYGSISRWYFYIYPDLACDLSKSWISVPETDKDLAKNKIIISRTERYTNENINYSFLKKYEDDVLFTGTMREYNKFCMGFDLNIKKLAINNFLELAQAIQQCKFHISNQTMAFQISEGLKHPRILELCSYAPNVIPIGENAFDFFSQYSLEWYFNHLLKQ